MKKRNAIELTGIFVKDSENNFTGFFSELPEAVSQGETLEEAEKKLLDILPDILELKKRMVEEDINENQSINVFKKTFSFEAA